MGGHGHRGKNMFSGIKVVLYHGDTEPSPCLWGAPLGNSSAMVPQIVEALKRDRSVCFQRLKMACGLYCSFLTDVVLPYAPWWTFWLMEPLERVVNSGWDDLRKKIVQSPSETLSTPGLPKGLRAMKIHQNSDSGWSFHIRVQEQRYLLSLAPSSPVFLLMNAKKYWEGK